MSITDKIDVTRIICLFTACYYKTDVLMYSKNHLNFSDGISSPKRQLNSRVYSVDRVGHLWKFKVNVVL